jgi:hypothetical protein
LNTLYERSIRECFENSVGVLIETLEDISSFIQLKSDLKRLMNDPVLLLIISPLTRKIVKSNCNPRLNNGVKNCLIWLSSMSRRFHLFNVSRLMILGVQGQKGESRFSQIYAYLALLALIKQY